MNRASGLHHLALSTADMKAQIAFFSDVLGMELVALYWMHGAEKTVHGFLRLNDRSSIAFVQNEAIAAAPRRLGVSHAGHAGGVSAGGTMQHLALRVDTPDELLAMRDRIRSRGVNVFGPIDHGMCQSIYLAGPEDLALEISTSAGPIDAAAWIDPEVVAYLGIDAAAELPAYRQPADYVRPAEAVPQPDPDPAKPHLRIPEKAYRRILAMDDAAYTARMSETEPPVPAARR
ncbi:MAG: VOC family protein [Pseudomonadota bacterium]|nr:VOC family protein [Pseudomonadota bacterium]